MLYNWFILVGASELRIHLVSIVEFWFAFSLWSWHCCGFFICRSHENWLEDKCRPGTKWSKCALPCANGENGFSESRKDLLLVFLFTSVSWYFVAGQNPGRRAKVEPFLFLVCLFTLTFILFLVPYFWSWLIETNLRVCTYYNNIAKIISFDWCWRPFQENVLDKICVMPISHMTGIGKLGQISSRVILTIDASGSPWLFYMKFIREKKQPWDENLLYLFLSPHPSSATTQKELEI